MPVAVVQEWLEEETDRSTTNYDALHERIMQSGPIEGFLLHAAGFTGRGFRIFAVWETREQFDRFVEQRLMRSCAISLRRMRAGRSSRSTSCTGSSSRPRRRRCAGSERGHGAKEPLLPWPAGVAIRAFNVRGREARRRR